MEDFVDKLSIAGLTPNEANTYVLLLEKTLTVSQISQILGINRSNLYSNVKNLVKKGFCKEITGNVARFKAIEPELALKGTMEKIRKDLSEMESLSLKLSKRYKEHDDSSYPDQIKILHSPASIINTLEKLEMKTESEVLAFSKPPYMMNVDDFDKLNPAQRESAEKGVKYRGVHQIEPDNMDNFLARMQHFTRLGEEIRVTEELPLKLFIFDKKTVVFTLENDEKKIPNQTFTAFENSGLALTFTQIFESYWKKAIPLKEFLEEYKES